MRPPPRKPRTVALEKTRRAARPAKPQEASEDTAPREPPREEVSAVRKKVIARLKRFHPMD